MKKKILCIIMAVTLMATAFAVPAVAEESVADYTLSLEKAVGGSVMPSTSFDVNIVVTSTTETVYNYVQMKVSYDSTKVKFMSYAATKDGSEGEGESKKTYNNTCTDDGKGVLTITCYGDEREITSGEAIVGKITFKALTKALDVKSGETPITSLVTTLSIGDKPLVGKSNIKESIGDVGEDLKVTIAMGDYMIGDVTGKYGVPDGEIGPEDITAIARHVAEIAFIEDANLLLAADANQDGEVGPEDITDVARYVAEIVDCL